MRKIIAFLLRWQARRILHRVKPIVIGVTGSIGKTSTTQAIAVVLQERLTIRKTYGNYNTDIGIPLSLFEQRIPSNLSNPASWFLLLFKNELRICTTRVHTFDVAVLELGTDSIGEIATYSWLEPDVAVVTAIAPEHMEVFGDMNTVATEELSVISYSKEAILNENMVEKRYVDSDSVQWYSGDSIKKEYKAAVSNLIGEHSYDAVAAAVSVAEKVGLHGEEILAGLRNIKAQPGRMNKLNGVANTVLIDDTYNSSPEAARAAIKYLGSCRGTKVLLFGNMNELGNTSAEEHASIGNLCDPKTLSLVVTLGIDANTYTAKAAVNNGCSVIRTQTPYEAGQAIKEFITTHKGEVTVLCKGSQNGVFAEEAVKILLKDAGDSRFLVRQSEQWIKKKQNSFKKVGV